MQVRALDLFLDSDGLIQSVRRIDRSLHLAYEVKNHILIGKHHQSQGLLDCHSRCSHLWTGSTLTELRRSGYWVQQGRQALNNVQASCIGCRRYNTRPVLPKSVASLLSPRADFEVPYKHTRVDFTGHLWVRYGSWDRKMYFFLLAWMSGLSILN